MDNNMPKRIPIKPNGSFDYQQFECDKQIIDLCNELVGKITNGCGKGYAASDLEMFIHEAITNTFLNVKLFGAESLLSCVNNSGGKNNDSD